MLPHWLVTLLLVPRGGSVLVVVRRLRTGSQCPTAIDACPVRAPSNCTDKVHGTGSMGCAQAAILKVPRTGSTWLTKELRAFGSGVQLEFEPYTDPAAHVCGGRFYTQALSRSLSRRQRCVTRESRSLPCYWGWLGCNASRLQPRPNSMVKGKPARQSPDILTGFLLNPIYAPGAIWNRVLGSQPRAKLVWLRRTNLVKMALSDIRRLAGATARQRSATSPVGDGNAEERFVEPRTLLTRLNMTLVTQATFPAATALDRGFLILYEDLQSQRLAVLRSLLGFLGLQYVPAIAAELAKQQASEMQPGGGGPSSQATHWEKASEDVCKGLPSGNCEALRQGMQGKPCLLRQLLSKTVRPWSFPNHEGTLSLAELDGECAELAPLPLTPSALPAAIESGDAVLIGSDGAGGERTVESCTHGRRTLFDLYGTRLPATPPATAAAGAKSTGAGLPAIGPPTCGRHRRVQISESYVLPFSLTREAAPLPRLSSSLSPSLGRGGDGGSGGGRGGARAAAAGGSAASGSGGSSSGQRPKGGSAVPAPHMVCHSTFCSSAAAAHRRVY